MHSEKVSYCIDICVKCKLKPKETTCMKVYHTIYLNELLCFVTLGVSFIIGQLWGLC